MTTELITQDLWMSLTKAVQSAPSRCDIAVAYFGKGAGKLLPITFGSRLVVDASEGSVASGQTCPADLTKQVERGVRVFSVQNLHAKVFVMGRTAFIGSSNASNRSANHLIEAAIRTTESSTVQAARRFVRDNCLQELTPEVLKKLAKLYKPPLIPGVKKRKGPKKDTSNRPILPRVFLQDLELVEWSESDQKVHDNGMKVAKKLRKYTRNFELDSFSLHKKCPYQFGDVVVQVLDEGGGRIMASPPGTVLHIRTRRNGTRSTSFVYLERPSHRRRSVKALAKALGYGALKKLKTEGKVKDASFAQALLNIWTG